MPHFMHWCQLSRGLYKEKDPFRYGKGLILANSSSAISINVKSHPVAWVAQNGRIEGGISMHL